jgi:hypothetical protein
MGYKMTGFSGFGNSPMKKKIWPPTKGEFDIDYDEIDKEGNPNYSDPTDPKSPNYNPKHGGHDFVKPKKNVDPFSDEEQAYENAQNDYDTDNPTKAQLAASLTKLKKDK